MKALIVFGTLLYAVLSQPTKTCKDGPSYWCQNLRTARECGAINFCQFEHQEEKKQKSTKNLDAPPVNVTLYYESLCPSCKQVFLYQIWPSFEKLKSTGILNLKFVPYGNAQQRQSGNQWIFYCQHGQSECIGNLIESCAIYHNPDETKYVPFLHCMEYYGPYTTNAEYCASLAGIDYRAITTCVNSEEGNKIEHQMGLETEALNPPHQYVPWFTMNGYHTQTVQNQLSSNFLNYVCQAYTGTKPRECYAANEIKGCARSE